MGNIYHLSDADRRLLQDAIQRVRAGSGSQKPERRRRGSPGGGKAASPIRRGILVGEIFGMSIDVDSKSTSSGIGNVTQKNIILLKRNPDGLGFSHDPTYGEKIKGINETSQQWIRGSVFNPIIVTGTVETINDEIYFFIGRSDLNGYQGYVKGSDPLRDAQALYREGGSNNVMWGGDKCIEVSAP